MSWIKENIWEIILLTGLFTVAVGVWMITPIAALIFIGASMVTISLYMGMFV